MAYVVGPDQLYVTKQKKKYQRIGLGLVSLLFLGCFALAVNLVLNFTNSLVLLIADIVFFALFFIIKRITDRVGKKFDDYKKGELGEKAVARLAAYLPTSYTAVNDVVLPYKKGNIDCVVIGAHTLFTLEVKNIKPAIYYTMYRPIPKLTLMKICSQAYAEAKALEEYLKAQLDLKCEVKPMVVLVDPYFQKWSRPNYYRGVEVLPANLLNREIVRQSPPTYNPESHRIREAIQNLAR